MKGRSSGNGDVKERLPGVGAVDGRGLFRLDRNALQARQENEGHERSPLPDVQADQGDPRCGRVAEPGDGVAVMPQVCR